MQNLSDEQEYFTSFIRLAAGDALLKRVSVLLKRPVQQRDTVARLGGDEFGLLLENRPAGQAREVAEGVRELLVGCRFQRQGATFVAGESIGIALIDGSSESKGELLRKADLACFTAKELGRNRVYEHRDEDTELSKRLSEWRTKRCEKSRGRLESTLPKAMG